MSSIKCSEKNRRHRRIHKVVVLLNDEEKFFVESYCKKNKIASKGKFFRETAIRSILYKLHKYSPTLFDE